MSKPSTDPGLGPTSSSEPHSGRQTAEERKNAITEPGIGTPSRKADTVDDLLDGFGPARSDIPRILRQDDTTPPPEPVRKELTPTAPGKRQKQRNTILALSLSFLVVVAIGVLVVKAGTSSSNSNVTPTTTPAMKATATAPDTATAIPTPPAIATMNVESLPSAKTANPAATGRPHSVSTTSAATTQPTAHPIGSAPPGMNLLPDDPHR